VKAKKTVVSKIIFTWNSVKVNIMRLHFVKLLRLSLAILESQAAPYRTENLPGLVNFVSFYAV